MNTMLNIDQSSHGCVQNQITRIVQIAPHKMVWCTPWGHLLCLNDPPKCTCPHQFLPYSDMFPCTYTQAPKLSQCSQPNPYHMRLSTVLQQWESYISSSRTLSSPSPQLVRDFVEACVSHTSCTRQETITYRLHRWWGVQAANLQNMQKGGQWWPRYNPPAQYADPTDLHLQVVRRLILPWWTMRRYRISLVLSKIPWLLTHCPQWKESHLQTIQSTGAWRPTYMNSE